MIDDLLIRLESRAHERRLLAYPGKFASIASEDDFMVRLKSLEADGALFVKRARVDGVDMVVSIRPGDIAKLYAYRGRTSSRTLSLEAVDTIRALPELPPNAEWVLELVEHAWSRNVAWSGLKPGDTKTLAAALSLAKALNGLRGQAGDLVSVDYRTFSRRSCGDSKVLERRIRLVVELLNRLYPAPVGDGSLDDVDVLAELGVVKFPQPLLVSGTLSLDGVALPSVPFIGLPTEQSFRLGVTHPSYVLLVENFSSFIRHCREVNDESDALVVYAGGFPARAILRSILSLVVQTDCPIYHWGDVDQGGLRIFAYLEAALQRVGRNLVPHLMTAELLVHRGRPANRPMPAMPRAVSKSALSALWSSMLNLPSPLELEQEELDPISPLVER
ncbi:Wadjet anti-phage system protein JetD domain-containing protein [Mesorhizobium tamadayense]|nr:Wadjet anti-phage system protein JetD domain-containing protein [Mesorhizobium tamadayense]